MIPEAFTEDPGNEDPLSRSGQIILPAALLTAREAKGKTFSRYREL